MLIVDAHVHIWSGGKPTNPNHRQVPVFSKDDLLKEMDEVGVDGAVIHPPASWDPGSELAVEAARQHPDRLAILGNFPLDRPESRALIDGWKSRPGMLGLRFTFLQPHQKTWPTDGTIDWLCHELPGQARPDLVASAHDLDRERSSRQRVAEVVKPLRSHEPRRVGEDGKSRVVTPPHQPHLRVVAAGEDHDVARPSASSRSSESGPERTTGRHAVGRSGRRLNAAIKARKASSSGPAGA